MLTNDTLSRVIYIVDTERNVEYHKNRNTMGFTMDIVTTTQSLALG